MSQETRASDVIVIGGGVIGLSAAYELARAGLKVRVLEKGACGKEASWSGAGVLQCGSWHRRDPLVHLLRESLRLYRTFAPELLERTGIDPEFIQCGSFELLLDDQQYRMAASEVRAAGEYAAQWDSPVLELLTPEAAREREPNLAPELLGVKYSPVTCQVRNPRLIAALQRACLLEKIEIVEGCAVESLCREGSRVVGVNTTGGTFSSACVILAAGAWSALVDPQLREVTPVYPVRGQIVLLEMQPRPFTHIVERGKCYMVPRLDGRVVIGATEEHESGYSKRNTAEGVATLLTLAQRLVPLLARAELVTTWSGLRPGTPDRAPFIGPVPGHEGLIAATGHFRSGLILAPMTAKIVRELVTTGRTSHDLSRLAPGREFRKDHRPEVLDESACA
jgi:glycine oxidase